MATIDSAKLKKRSVMLVDDHPIVRQGLAELINQEPDLHVTALAPTAAAALVALDQSIPDIAIVDISLEDRSGIELIKDLRSRTPGMPILALSMHDESLYAERALRAGAKGYIMKQEATDQVMTAIRRVLEGQIYVSERMAGRLINQLVSTTPGNDDSPLGCLTDREMEIFLLIGKGMSTRDIANKLFLSIKTIEAHREHIKDKLKIKTGAELMRLAIQHALEAPRPK